MRRQRHESAARPQWPSLAPVVFGPGSIAQAHGIDEWVEISQLIEATAIYAELYRSIGPGWA